MPDGEIIQLSLLEIPQWWSIREIDRVKQLERVLNSRNFAQALQFTNKVGDVAEEEDHNSLIMPEYGW